MLEEGEIEEGEIDDCPHAPRDERAFGWNDSVLDPRDSAFKPSNAPVHVNAPVHGAFGGNYPRDLGYHVKMRDLHLARGGASGHYGGKSGGDEERGRKRDRNTDFQHGRHSDRDRDRDRGSGRDRQYTLHNFSNKGRPASRVKK